MMGQWLRRLAFLIRGRRFDADLDSELQFHIDMRARALEDAGASPADARRAAHLEVGNHLRLREDARDVWITRTLARLAQDLRFGWRTLRRSPTFSLTVVVTLALGLGANIAIFSVVDAVLLKPLPYADADRLVLLWSTSPAQPLEPLTPGNFFDFRTRLTTLSGLAGVSHLSVTLTGHDLAERHAAMSVSSDFFDVLGVSAERGRTFGPVDGPGAHVVVLSQRMWLSTFHGDPNVIGGSITINTLPFVVTGVMSRTFTLPSITPRPAGDAGPDLWIPGDVHEIPGQPIASAPDLRQDRSTGYLRAIGRLKPGVSLIEAQAEVSGLAATLARDYPVDNAQLGAQLVPFAAHLAQDTTRPLQVLFGAVGLVLAIACANVANLLLGRTAARRQEIAIRVALGASRWRVIRQLLTESVLLGVLAGVAGLCVGQLMLGWLIGLGPASLLRLPLASIDSDAMTFAGVLAMLTSIIFGTLPAIQASRSKPGATLTEESKRASDSRAKQRLRRVLVALEVAIACVLLMSAALLGRSFWTLTRVDPGYDAHNVLAFELFLSGPRAQLQSRQLEVYEPLLDRIRALPGVTSAGAVINLPVGGDDFGTQVIAEGAPPVRPGESPRVNYQVASAQYFQTMRVPLRDGRDFSSADTRDAPHVVIVNDEFARRYWPGASAVGRRVHVGSDAAWRTIVGVIGDVRHGGLSAPVKMELYVPYTQSSFPFMSFVVRVNGNPLALTTAVRQALAQIDPGVPMSGVSTLEERLHASVADTRFLSILLVAFAVVALLVASVGVYGVVALGVVQRTREIGVRLALGASHRQVMGMLVRQGIGSALAGLTAGVGLSLAAGRALQGLLFGVTAHDSVALAVVPCALAAVALLAAYLPARRAAGIAPSVALRSEQG